MHRRLQRGIGRIAFAIVALALSSCAHPGKEFAVGSFDRGRAEYEGKRYTEAVETLKLFIRRNPRDPGADDAQFLIGQCYMEAKDYPLAAVEFEILRTDYPNSDLVDDAVYLEAMAFAYQTPNYLLDQKVTHRALDALRKYMSQFPQGKHHAEVQAEIEKLEFHLARKKLAQAKQYVSLHQYKAAAIVLDDLLAESPDSPLRPQMLLVRGQTAQKLGDTEAAAKAFQEILTRYPDGDAAAEARQQLRDLDKDAREKADTARAPAQSGQG